MVRQYAHRVSERSGLIERHLTGIPHQPVSRPGRGSAGRYGAGRGSAGRYGAGAAAPAATAEYSSAASAA